MLDFNKLKETEIKKEWTIEGETIRVKNPTNEQKNKISELLKGKAEVSNNQLNVNIDSIGLFKELFNMIVEGVDNLPEDDNAFKDVIENPRDELKEILDVFYDVIRSLSMDGFKNKLKELDTLEAQLEMAKMMEKMNKLSKKYKIDNKMPNAISLNGSEPIKLTEEPKAKKTRKKKTEVTDEVKDSEK